MWNSKSQPKDFNFSKGTFSGLIFCPAYIQTFEFSNLNIEKKIWQGVGNYYSYKLRLLHKLGDSSLSYLWKDKNDIKQKQ